MKPQYLRLAGFAGIQSGLGKSEITLDFSTLPDGLVAIAGPNGAGKTTIMDNMHPYRVMPSRSNGNTPGSFSYYEEMAAQAAEKELIWSHCGQTYRSLVKLRHVGKSKKQEAYLFESRDGDWVPFVNARGTISDGKAETYDECVNGILGLPEVFFNSQFSAQGKRPVSAMAVPDVKNLMAAMLGAEGLKALSTKCGEVVRLLKPNLVDLQLSAEPLLATVSREEALMGRKHALGSAIQEMGVEISRNERDLEGKIGKLSAQEAASMTQETIKAQFVSLDQQVEALKSGHVERLSKFDQNAIADVQAAEEAIQVAKRTETHAKSVQNAARERVATALSLISQEQEAVRADAETTRLRAKLGAQRAQVDDLQFDAKPIADLRDQMERLVASCSSEAAKGEALAQMIEVNRKTAALLGEVPCGGTEYQAKCKLIANANSAQVDLKMAEVSITALRETYRQKVAARNGANARLQTLLDAEKRFRAAQEALMETQNALEQSKSTAGLLTQINVAKEALPGELKARDEANAAVEAAQAQVQTSENTKSTLRDSLKSRRSQLIQGFNAELERIEAVKAALPKVVDEAELGELRAAVAAQRSVLQACRANLEDARAQAHDVAYDLGLVAKAKEELATLQARITAVGQEISYWVLLQKALGNDGIIALSIDDAGPSIAKYCNQLLDECFGGRFSARLETQKANDAGVARETFEVMVTDTLRGEEKLIEKMSGGEKVWVNECLVRAMALYTGESSGQRNAFETLFSDESDGPLDPQRKREFMAMKRAVLEIGGYKREYLITHTPELRQACDAVIDITAI